MTVLECSFQTSLHFCGCFSNSLLCALRILKYQKLGFDRVKTSHHDGIKSVNRRNIRGQGEESWGRLDVMLLSFYQW